VDWHSTVSTVDVRFLGAGIAGLIAVALVCEGVRRLFGSRPRAASSPSPTCASLEAAAVPRIVFDETETETEEVASAKGPCTKKIVYDEDAIVDEPTAIAPLFVLSASSHSDKGRHRSRNEDSVLMLEKHGLFAVADGMGGLRGGEVASAIAVDTLRATFETRHFDSVTESELPRRAAELAAAIREANAAILGEAKQRKELAGMGTTLSAARFSVSKQRLYLAHIGDSRVYRFRGRQMTRMTKDHTMEELGVQGDDSGNLSRALGVWPRVAIDIILAKPLVGDLYLLCSDGLTKMVDESRIARMLFGGPTIDETARALVEAANASGGKDNISVVLVKVDAATLA
jgi:serine/threonine protein phosphatase PrpC